MDFSAAESTFISLWNQLQANIITQQQYASEVEKLSFQDKEGRYWCISQTGLWMWWNGQQWVEYSQIQMPAMAYQSQYQQTGTYQQPQQAGQPVKEKLPDSFFGLLLFIIKKIPGTLKKRLPSILLTTIIGWLAHTYIMVGLNQGFNIDSNRWFTTLLNARGQRLGSGLLWGIIGMALPFLFDSIKSGRFISVIGRLITAPKMIAGVFKKSGAKGFPMVLVGAGIAFIVGRRLGMPTNLILGAAVLSALGTMGRSFIMLIVMTAWQDIKKWTMQKVQNKTRIKMDDVAVFMSGISLGFIFINIGFLNNYGTTIGIIMIVLALILKFTNVNTKRAMMLTVGFIAWYCVRSVVLADDGGEAEAGGWANWARSEGALRAFMNGLLPGISIGGGLLIGNIIRNILRSLGLDSLIPADFPVDVPFDVPADENVTDPNQMQPDGFKYWIEMSSQGGPLKTDNTDTCWVYAKVCTDNPQGDAAGLTGNINFGRAGQYGSLINFGEYGYVQGYKAIMISASMPMNVPANVKTGSATVTSGTVSPSGYISGNESISLMLMGQGARIETSTMPGGTRELRVGDPNIVWLYGRVVSTDAETGETIVNQEATSSIRFAKTGEGQDWLSLSEDTAYAEGGWIACGAKAVNPYGDSVEASKAKAPQTATALVSAAQGETVLSARVVFTIIAKSDLSIDKKNVNFASKSQDSDTVTIEVLNPGTEAWYFEYELDQYAEGLFVVESDETDPKGYKYTMKLAEADESSDEKSLNNSEPFSRIMITAKRGNEELKGEIIVRIMREGLYIDSFGADGDGSHSLKADGKATKEIRFLLMIYDPKSKTLKGNKEALTNLTLQYKMTDDILVQNAAQVTELDLTLKGFINDRCAAYTASTKRVFHAKPKSIPVYMIVNANVPDKPPFSKEFIIKIIPEDIGPGSKAYEEEYRKCMETIEKIVPDNEKSRFISIVEDKREYVDADGLVVLRKIIIREAMDMNQKLHDGYLNEALWYDKAIYWCEKAQLMGEIAIQALEIAFLGPLAGVGSGIVRSMAMSAYNAHVEGKTMEQWLDDEIGGFFGAAAEMGLGFVTDPSVIEEFIGKSPKAQAMAWGVFVGYNFIHALYKGMSVWEAAKHVGEVFAQRAAVQFLAGKLVQTRCVVNAEKAIKDLGDMVSRDANGNPTLPPGVAEKVMMDPQFVRSVKNCGNENLKQAFENSLRNDVYKPHDQALTGWIKENVPGMSDVEVRVQDFRTPKIDGGTEPVNVNADRDYRVVYKDNVTGEWKEIRRDWWEKKSYAEFAKASGFKEDTAGSKLGIDKDKWNDMSLEEKTEAWARSFRQTPTDAAHIVSSRDFSDQVMNPETGRPFQKIDAEGNPLFETNARDSSGNPVYTADPKASNIAVDAHGNPVPAKASNIELVKAGKSKLIDPRDMGELYERKAFDEWQLNGSKSEAIEQVKKGMKELEAVREGYEKQGINVESSPDYQNLKTKFSKIETDLSGKVKVDNVDPRDINKALAHLGNEFKKFPPLGR